MSTSINVREHRVSHPAGRSTATREPRALRYHTRQDLVRFTQLAGPESLGAVISTVRSWHAAGLVTANVRIRAYGNNTDLLTPIAQVTLPGCGTRSVGRGWWFFVRTDGILRISEEHSRPFPETVTALQYTGPLAVASMLDLVRERRAQLDGYVDLRPGSGPGGKPTLVLHSRRPHLDAMTGLDAPVGVREHGALILGEWLVVRAHSAGSNRVRLNILADKQFRAEFEPISDAVLNPVDARAGRSVR
jgi:hypothetical protein